MLKCYECDSQLHITPEEEQVGQIIICPQCGAEHEIISLQPLNIILLNEEK